MTHMNVNVLVWHVPDEGQTKHN